MSSSRQTYRKTYKREARQFTNNADVFIICFFFSFQVRRGQFTHFRMCVNCKFQENASVCFALTRARKNLVKERRHTQYIHILYIVHTIEHCVRLTGGARLASQISPSTTFRIIVFRPMMSLCQVWFSRSISSALDAPRYRTTGLHTYLLRYTLLR